VQVAALAIALKPSTFLSFHRAMVQCKYCRQAAPVSHFFGISDGQLKAGPVRFFYFMISASLPR
jgi:hypothetical protein